MFKRQDMNYERSEQAGATIAFRAPAELVAACDRAAAAEGLSRSDIARRSLMRAVLQQRASDNKQG